MFLVKTLGAVDMRGIEEERALPLEYARPDIVAYPVVGVIPKEGSRNQQREQAVHVHRAGRRHGAGDKQQRVTRQERRHHQPGFAVDDEEQDQIDPCAVSLDQHRQVLVQMQDDIEELREKFHWPC